ncbi:hypothetical protein BI347_17950 [Chromobacterium sphagni]|uniref:DEAD/DEAH box helicase n=1 Tax=Chromobacterium sphagni TaxID=1903179 RepID=A0A1S1WW49_9NEIS|nr:DEAD/DEAH box helicase [Chromobacterium sphagni]OHX11544.1 hypothetical protein BI347_17950 [Chromobacterium sphagni]
MTSPYRPYIQPLIKDLLTRSQRAALGLLGVSSKPLRIFLTKELSQAAGEAGSLLADPVFEPTFGWTPSDQTMSSLSGGLLHPRLVDVMANPPKKLFDDYEFPCSRQPFSHQLEAWQTLAIEPPRSLVVTSGTGSGKTECFLVPILDRLTRQAGNEGRLSGVRALFIYPLNALIASQKNRLDAWTDGLNGDVRYCLYTGNLPEEAPAGDREYAGQVLDRRTLRNDVPPMLVTNATMLEYMLVRKEDAPILDASQGKLEWIVLDEAHTHIGSQAAEMALLLRRVMLAFGVKPENVRFVATSATFGSDDETTNQLKSFLAKMAGVRTDQIHVVHGRRQVPELIDEVRPANEAESLAALEQIEPDSETSEVRYRQLATHPVARDLRAHFVNEKLGTLKSLQSRFSSQASGELLAWLDILSGTRNAGSQAFLPLRIHLFHKVISGLYACVDANCSCTAGTALAGEDWEFGMVYVEERNRCACGAPVLPLVRCNECNALHLSGMAHRGILQAIPREDEDEFELDRDVQEETDGDKAPQPSSAPVQSVLLVAKPYHDSEVQWLERVSARLLSRQEDGALAVRLIRELDHQYCPSCLHESNEASLFRRLAVGTPFTLGTVISTLLEYCPEDPSEPATKPFRGRKLISFTDSRQGTARTAAKLQQDSERNRVRALVYHHLLAAAGSGRLSDEDEQDLAELQQERALGDLSARDERTLNRLLADKAALQQAKLPWRELQSKLAGEPDIKYGLLDYYANLIPGIFEREIDANKLASMLLFREFARRPKRENSLETMGLAQVYYPSLEKVSALPDDWPKDLASWRHYLKVLLDFYVREGTCIQIPSEFLNVIGNRFSPRWLRPPSWKEMADSRTRIWAQVNPKGSQSRPVKLLMRAFNWSVDGQRDRMDGILRAAWDELVRVGLLRVGDGGYQLGLEEASLRVINKAGICPITRRLLDTVFEELTPYTNPKNPDAACKVEWVDMPRYPYPFGKGAEDLKRIAQARVWQASEMGVLALRDEGLWSDLSDRIMEGGAYFRAVEHSAQQDRKRLERYEDQFKAGKLNLMSCSTTMEMGVDIGGISVVAMNNVPPHPANYLQRAGRAGRRSESRAVALTVCKNTPHDQSVFDQPDWPFTARIAVPDVSLQSPELVMRHVYSWLLSYWLKNIVKNDEIRRMTCGPFFIQEGEWSVARRFVAWCEHPEANLDADLRQSLRRLIVDTPLAGQQGESLVRHTGKRMATLTDEWCSQHQSVCQQRAVFAGEKASSKALIALELQIERIEGEYLLSELANRRFLPGYGFPTDVVSLDNRNRGHLSKGKGDEREDNRGRRLQLPSRDRATALREYAPGAEIVLDGLVYRSAGVTLNWHIPINEEEVKKEAQLLKFAWRCHNCGASGSEIGHLPEICPEADCGQPLHKDQIHHYLVPSGFAVDFFATPHNDFGSPIYVSVKQPWLSVRGGWLSLTNPEAGRFRASNQAHLYHYSAGTNGRGYALCLECGRAEPMLSRSDPETELRLPEIFRKPHKRLRGDREEKTGSRDCLGSNSSWKIKQDIVLGHDSITDALEVVLRTPEGTLINDETLAFTLAVAMRAAIAKLLGVMEDELGCTTRVLWLEGQEARVIQVFDARTGGYSVLAAPRLQQRTFWDDVRKQLECHADCTSSCPHCLLSFDTRFAADHLDRHQALAFLTPQWLDQYELAAEHKVFGASTLPESATLLDAVERTLLQKDADTVRLYWHGHASVWDLPSAHALLTALMGWKVRGLDIELCAEQGALTALGEENRYKLASLLDLGASYCELPLEQMLTEHAAWPLLASVHRSTGWRAWATPVMEIGLPDEQWGRGIDGAMLLYGEPGLPSLPAPVSVGDVRPRTGDLELDLREELDGSIEAFGHAFWQLLCEKSPALAQLLEQDEVKSISYFDRYLKSPLPVSLLLSVLYELTRYSAASGGGHKCIVQSQPFQNARSSSYAIWHDWADCQERDARLKDALNYLGYEGEVRSVPCMAHGRLLEMTFTSGRRVRIRLDQGLSYWLAVRDRDSRGRSFPFNEAAGRQVDLLVNPVGKVEAPTVISTQLFLRIS